MNLLIWAANRWDNRTGYLLERFLCRCFHYHARGCRGRTDHIRDDGLIIDSGRWWSP